MAGILDLSEVVGNIISVMQGDITNIPALIKNLNNSYNSISDALFFRTLSRFLEGLDSDGTCSRKIGKKLAESNYGKEYGFMLLKYIDMFESAEKGTLLAHLLDVASKEFISVEECFAYVQLIKDVSLGGLWFIKENLSNRVITTDSAVLNELFRYGLVYAANEGGYAFEMQAFILDKFALSYLDKKYKYNGEDDFIPKREKFPAKVASIVTSQGRPY